MRKLLYLLMFIFAFCLLPKTAEAGIIFKPVFHTGLVGYWDFQEGAGNTAYDKSGYDNDGALENMATSSNGGWTDGKLGSALDFDGTDDYVTTNENALNFFSADLLTISVWVYPTDNSGSTAVNSGYLPGIISDSGTWVWMSNGSLNGQDKLWVGVFDGDADEIGVDYSLNEWTHVVMVLVDGILYGYKDGVLFDSIATGGLANGWVMEIGRNDWQSKYFTGKIDEVRIYNRGLSAGEVERLYKLSQPKIAAPTMTGLVGYWAFNEGKGAKARDSSFNSNHGDLTNMEESDWVNGKLGTALEFDGSNDYVTTNKNPSSFFGASTSTISVWLYPTSFLSSEIGYWGYLPGVVTNDGADLWITIGEWLGDNKIWVGIYDVDSPPYSEIGVPYLLNEWIHIVMVHQNNTLYAYKNGVLFDSVAAEDILNINGGDLVFGRTVYGAPDDTYFDGTIDEVRIYNRALEVSEIEALYKSGRAKINASQNDKLTDGLVGLWSFNGPDMDGDEAWDRSGEGNHGTLQNGPIPTIGKVGQALEFDGDNDVVEIAHKSYFTQAPFTASIWFKLDQLPSVKVGDEFLLRKTHSGSPYVSWGVWISSSDDKISFAVTDTGESWNYAYSNSAATVGKWYHVVAVMNDTNNIMYVDGIAQTTKGSPADIYSSDYPFYIGAAYDGADWFDGTIDEVRIYNRVLSAQEIQRLYNMGR